ncbi:hypothetical protein E3P98_04121 [Wallemia ichthyophaga]|nr:hypothetical protein E3P98_04121 [Wallemia ichthyophaga]
MTDIDTDFNSISLLSNHNKENAMTSIAIPKSSTSLKDNDIDDSNHNERNESSPRGRHTKMRSLSNPASDLDTDTGLLLRRVDETASTSRRHSLHKGKHNIIHAIEENDKGSSDIDWQFWGEVMANYEDVAHNQPHALSKAIQKGIPKELRGMLWQLMSSSKNPDLEALYQEYLKLSSVNDKAIHKDLSRTFPALEYFQDPDSVNWLFNVAKAYSLYDVECGYTQGILFVIGPLLLNAPDEEAFGLLIRLMQSYDLRGHYLPEMPGLHLRLFQFDRLLEEFLPMVYTHLTKQGVKSSMYASQWFMTLFSYRFPLDIVYRIFDNIFAEGIEAIFRFGIGLMKKNEDKLLSLQFENIVDFLKEGMLEAYRIPRDTTTRAGSVSLQAPLLRGTSHSSPHSSISGSVSPRLATSADSGEWDCDSLVSDAYDVKITPFQLDSYASEWAETCYNVNKHAHEVDELRLANRGLSSQIKKLEASLTQINGEHCELVKTLVNIRIEKDEMEESLINKLVRAQMEKAAAEEELQRMREHISGETPAALAELVTQVSPNSQPQRNTRQPVRKTKKKKQPAPSETEKNIGSHENTNKQPQQSLSTSENDAQSPHTEQPPQRPEQIPTTATNNVKEETQPTKEPSKPVPKQRKKKSKLSSFFSSIVPCVGESSRNPAHDISSSEAPHKTQNQPTVDLSQNNEDDIPPATPVIPSQGVDMPLSDTAGLTSGAVMPPGKELNPPTPSRQPSTHQHHESESSEEEEVDEFESELADEERIIAKGGMGIPVGEDGQPNPLLPPLITSDNGKKCLVLDLDETLVHSSFKLIQHADYVVPVEIESQTHNVYVIKRPGVDAFLKRMGDLFEIVVFTASLSKYADPVLDMLDINRVVRHRLFRESCYNHKGNYVKDLSQLGRLINDSIIIDNSPASYVFHPNNAVPVSSWFNDPHDTELTDLCPFLTDLTAVDDVRGILNGTLLAS